MLRDRDHLRLIPGNLTATNLKEVIEQRCRIQPAKVAINFLHDGELGNQEPLTYAELDAHARAILSALRTCSRKGERALLLFPAGNQFLAAFVACLYGGIVAVPVAVPGRAQDWARVFSIIEDCQPTVLLSCGQHFQAIERHLKSTPQVWQGSVIDVGELRAPQGAGVQSDEIAGDDLAFLQYTSGSTGNPKGVMVTHDNLLYNQRVIQTAFDLDENSRLVTWLPMFHDMGLIGCGLHALYLGVQLSYMAPEAFLQNPPRWLQAISHFRATSSGAPNFAYELCLARYRAEECKGLDLSEWRRAFNGAEPVRPVTLERFYRTYAQYGFGATALYPTYGLAEAVLLVSGATEYRLPKLLRVRADHYARGVLTPASSEEGGRVELVGVGGIVGGQRALIVDPQTLEPVARNHIGEVWLNGPSIAKGYWRKADISREFFRARPNGAGDEGREYLRTGDLGALDEHGELYITGRVKDTIIVNGKNYFPQDLEYVVEGLDKSLRLGGGAVVGVEHDDQERIVVLQELRMDDMKDADAALLIKSIRAKIASEFQLAVFDVCLLKPRTLHKTTSGKVQRQRNKQAYLTGELSVVARHRGREQRGTTAEPTSHAVFQMVRDWVTTLPDAPAHVAQDDLFVDVGMDSARAVNLAEHLSAKLSQPIDVGLVWSYPEIGRFCQAVTERLAGHGATEAEVGKPVEAKANIHEMDEDKFQALLAKELS